MKKKNKHKMWVETVGTLFPRYRVVDRTRGYWNGSEWQKDKGMLFYWFQEAADALKNIQSLENMQKASQKFTATVTVELIGDQPIDKKDLIDYLVREARFLLVNPSPNNSIVHAQIDWSTLKESKDGDRADGTCRNGGIQ